MLQWSNIMMEFSDSMDQYRDTLKSISIKQSTLQPGRDQKRKIKEKIDQLQGSLSSMDKVANLEQQLEQLEEFTNADEVEMNNFKRMATREALYILLNGMHAMASKTDIISTFGKYIVDELNVDSIQPGQERPVYQGEEKTKRVLEDAKKAIDEWNPDKTKIRRTLTSHHGHNPLIIKQLPPVPPEELSPSTSETLVLPPRNVSLEEKNKQYSFYKPDEQDDKPNVKPPLTSHLTPGGGPFSNMYLNNHQPLNQQNLYQFYQHYLPPKTYEEMTHSFSSGAVFRGEQTLKHDAGGFVLPSTNPNFEK